jgi:hypothetical protein
MKNNYKDLSHVAKSWGKREPIVSPDGEMYPIPVYCGCFTAPKVYEAVWYATSAYVYCKHRLNSPGSDKARKMWTNRSEEMLDILMALCKEPEIDVPVYIEENIDHMMKNYWVESVHAKFRPFYLDLVTILVFEQEGARTA